MPVWYAKAVEISCVAMLTELDEDVFGFVQGDLFEVGSNKDFDWSCVPVGRNRLRLVVRLQHVKPTK